MGHVWKKGEGIKDSSLKTPPEKLRDLATKKYKRSLMQVKDLSSQVWIREVQYCSLENDQNKKSKGSREELAHLYLKGTKLKKKYSYEKTASVMR